MSTLTFKADEVLRCINHTLAAPAHRLSYADEGPARAGLWLVGDRGVYLMSNGDPGDVLERDEKGEVNKLFVAYAEGINPEVDDFDTWWENKRDKFGGDDGAEPLPESWLRVIKEKIASGAKVIKINLTEQSVSLK